MKEYLVIVDVDGVLYAAWSDDLQALYEEGEIEVQRASNVEFNPTTQRWHVYEPEGLNVLMHDSRVGVMWPNLDGWRSREDALAWEREEIDRRLVEGKV